MKLKEITSLPAKELSENCKKLLLKLSKLPPSSRALRKAIKIFGAEIADEFDLAVDYDTNFVEVLSTHFINLYDGPRYPIQQKQLGRNTAFLTTIPILHNHFLDCNGKIDMQWLEKNAPATEATKWDGIAFKVNNRSMTPLFVELSGGINHNTGAKKALDDEEKLVVRFVDLLKIRKAENEELPVQYYIRFHDMQLYFESLTLFDECFVKRTHFITSCPTTTSDLQEFLQQLPHLYQYREALLLQLE